MIDEATINKAVELLQQAAPDATIILFGSGARGEAKEDSDLDFLVVEPSVARTLRILYCTRRLERGGCFMRSHEHAELLLRKAAQDQFTLEKLFPDPASPDEVIGFHAEQAVEKC